MEQKTAAARSPISRRRFLSAIAVAGVGAALGRTIMGERGVASAKTEDEPAKRQWAIAIDLRKCEGCVTDEKPPRCIEGCNAEHFVPKGQEWIKVVEEERPGGHTSFMLHLCMQCENAPCVKVCPVGATYRTAQGVVLVNHERCIGCRMCMAACPYGARSFNWQQPENPPGATFAQYSPEYPVPHRGGTVEKCMLCAHRTKDGKLPACADACPMYAIYLGDLTEDIATNGKAVTKLSHLLGENGAYRWKEELGTRPRVWYIPGYGQEYGRNVDDRRKAIRARPWQELEKAPKEAKDAK